MMHILKTWTGPFNELWHGHKTAEFRRDDRGFRLFDQLVLMEYDHINEVFLNRALVARVTHIASNADFGIPAGYVVLSLKIHHAIDEYGEPHKWPITD